MSSYGSAVDQTAGNNAATIVYANSLIVKAKPGRLLGFTVYSSLGSAQWIQVHDSATVPADTAVPVISLVCATIANLVVDFGPRGKYFPTGIVIVNSTTGPTKTIGAANCWIEARYI